MSSRSKKSLSELLRDPSKSNTLKIADLVASTTLSNSGIPGANAVYDFAKFGVNAVRQYLTDRQDTKIVEFHNSMLNDKDDTLDEEVINADIEMVDYHALLEACVSDIEMEKNCLYGRLAKSIASNKIASNIKRHYILSLKELTWNQLDLLARLYVLTKYPIQPIDGPGRVEASEAIQGARHDSVEGLDIAALKARGFVYGSQITELCAPFLSAIFPQEHLTPEPFQYKQWSGSRFALFQLSDLYETMSISQTIQRHYRKMGIAGGIGPMEGALDRATPMPFNLFFIIVYRNGKTLTDLRKSNLLEIIKDKAAVQIVICEKPDESPIPILDIPHVVFPAEEAHSNLEILDEKIAQILQANRQNKAM